MVGKSVENGNIVNKSGTQVPRRRWGWEVNFLHYSTIFTILNIFMVLFALLLAIFRVQSVLYRFVGFFGGEMEVSLVNIVGEMGPFSTGLRSSFHLLKFYGALNV